MPWRQQHVPPQLFSPPQSLHQKGPHHRRHPQQQLPENIIFNEVMRLHHFKQVFQMRKKGHEALLGHSSPANNAQTDFWEVSRDRINALRQCTWSGGPSAKTDKCINRKRGGWRPKIMEKVTCLWVRTRRSCNCLLWDGSRSLDANATPFSRNTTGIENT